MAKEEYASIIGDHELIEMVRLTILGEDYSKVVAVLRAKALEFVLHLASNTRRGKTLTPTQWAEAYNFIEKGDQQGLLTYLLEEDGLKWSKTTTIKSLTETAKTLMAVASELGVGLTSTELPMCMIASENRRAFAQRVAKIYPGISDDFLNWLQNEGPLTVCWLTGFKPQGDDGRPDRGLPPLARMLIGPYADILTVVYGPGRPAHWRDLKENPGVLSRKNGLWEAVMVTSNAVLVDSSTDSVTNHGFLQDHWADTVVEEEPVVTSVTPTPKRIGENDVDTVIHTLLACLGGPQVFEGLCNPPGGDWSGVSVLTHKQDQEFRWLSLPRVSGAMFQTS